MNRVFSGIQPTGVIHIGNYVGAIQNWVKIQHDYPSIFCVVDYHATTISYDVEKMPDQILNTAITLLACGIDPEVSTLLIQSWVPEHANLAWLLGTVTPYGDLTRMTQFKDKSRQHSYNINTGLFYYPVLMAADILLYKANKVPVGEDQIQHLELAREICRKFNSVYGEVFPEPQPLLTEVPRLMGLDGESKMSKSMNNFIALEETQETLWDKLRTAKTDENRIRRTDPGDPEKCNIYYLHKIFSAPDEVQTVNTECRRAGFGCIDCKKILNQNLWNVLEPIQQKLVEYRRHLEGVREILVEGSRKCRKIAGQTMEEVRENMGLTLFKERE